MWAGLTGPDAALKTAALHLNLREVNVAPRPSARHVPARNPMTPTPEFKRKNIRLPGMYYTGRRSYFLTLCFDGRRRFGANPRIANWLIARLRCHAAACAFFIHAYCVMPDHKHVLATASSDESDLWKFTESFKQETAFEFERRARRRLWQLKYYDRIPRSSDAVDRVAWYIWLNPGARGVVPGAVGISVSGVVHGGGDENAEERSGR